MRASSLDNRFVRAAFRSDVNATVDRRGIRRSVLDYAVEANQMGRLGQLLLDHHAVSAEGSLGARYR